MYTTFERTSGRKKEEVGKASINRGHFIEIRRLLYRDFKHNSDRVCPLFNLISLAGLFLGTF